MRVVTASVALVLTIFVTALAQIITGTIQGTVKDQTGAVLPGVSVTVKNLDTNQSRNVLTNDTGAFTVPLLQVGKYEVSAELSGFGTQVKTGLELQVEQRMNLEFILSVGELSERLVVTEAAPLVQADTASVGNVVDTQKLVELPLNGRRFSQVALLVPTATTLPSGTLMARPERDSFSVAGLRSAANNFMIDGIDNNDISINIAAAKPSVDTIREYKILSGTYTAEFGRGGGAQINVVTKSGGNDFHGSIYHFLRNSALDAKNFFDPAAEPIPSFNRNQFGATIGGPIKKDKTFFYFGYEGLKSRQAITRTATVAEPAWRQGDFSSLLLPNNRLGAAPRIIRDPFNSNQPFPGNIIPGDRFDPSGYAILNLYPNPNKSGTTNFVSSPPERLNWHQPSLRIDQVFSEKDTLFWRINYNELRTRIPFDGTTDLPGFGKNSKTTANNMALVETHVFNPSVVNELRLGYNYFREHQPNQNQGFDGTEQILGIKNTSRLPIDLAYPNISITGLTLIGDRTSSPQDRKVHTYQIYDGLSIIRGNHSIKIGGEIRRIQNNFVHHENRRGSFVFTGAFTNAGPADVLLGIPLNMQINRGFSQRYFRSTSLNLFIQEDWKVNRRFTLNLGLRYEINTAPLDKDNLISSFNIRKGVLELVGKDGVPRGIFPTDYNNFGPRLGLAYNLTDDGRTIMRAGYGMYFNQQTWAAVLVGAAAGYPFVQQFQFNSSTTRPELSLRDPFPTGSALSRLSFYSQDSNFRSGYVQHFSFGIQRELPRNTVVELSYLGNKGTKLDLARPINQPTPGPGTAAQVNARRPFPQYGNFNHVESSAISNFNSMIVRVEKRFSDGMTFLLSYTAGKAIHEIASPDMRNNRMGRGPADIDNRHRWTLSYVYELPFGPQKPWGSGATGAVGKLIGGWQASGVMTLRSGQAFTPNITADRSNTTLRRDRPVRVGDWKKDNPDPNAGWWNPAAFQLNDPFTFGNAGTGILYGPDLRNLDFSLSKNTDFSENKRLEFRAEFFNLTNHPNFGQPNVNVDTALFGKVFQALDSRQIQFGLRIVY